MMSGNQSHYPNFSPSFDGQFNGHHQQQADIGWQNSSGLNQNNSDFSVSLNAIKHDHSFMPSCEPPPENVTNTGNELLIGATGLPSADQSLVNQWIPCETEKTMATAPPYCMPYGYCYDDGTLLAQAQPRTKSDFSDILPITMEDEWIINNKYLGCEPDLNCNQHQFWSGSEFSEKPIKVEDAFQLDKADLKSGPTLAELNSTTDVWDAIDLDELLASSNSLLASSNSERLRTSYKRTCNQMENPCLPVVTNVPAQTLPVVEEDAKLQENIDYLTSILTVPSKQNSVTPTVNVQLESSRPSTISPPVEKKPKLENVVLSNILNTATPDVSEKSVSLQAVKEEQTENTPSPPSVCLPVACTSSSSVPACTPTPASTTAPSTRNRNSSMSTDCSFSSHDEGFDSETENSSDDESFYGDYEAKDLLGATTSDDANNKWALNMGRSRKSGQQRYFWQYNVQSKGPKGTRIAPLEDTAADPHVLCEASDPVFSPDCHVQGVKHAGKARRGDGNDLTPNPKKLLMIGLELKKLSRIINELTPVAEVPVTARNKSRKEKNKLASRACRLKKKAQHEANKIKLFGLQEEHKKMISILLEIRKLIQQVIQKKYTSKQSFSTMFEQLVAQKGAPVNVAGRTTEFVNTVLDSVAAGSNTGGLDMI